MPAPVYHSPASPIQINGTYTVISPDDRGKEQPQIYYLNQASVVLTWGTRQGRENTVWARDVLNNVWTIIDPDDPDEEDD